MKQTRTTYKSGRSSRTGFLPLQRRVALRLCLLGKFTPVAIVARSAQQCAIIAEAMHAYNLLGNRIEVYAPQAEGMPSWTMPES